MQQDRENTPMDDVNGQPDNRETTAADEQAAAAPDTVDTELQTAKEEAERYLANWQRAQADLINYRRRAEQEKEDAVKYGSAGLLRALLPIFDDLERAIANVPDDVAGTSWFEGLQLLERKLASTLQTQGIEEIPAEGEAFDPNVHEAVMFEPGDEGKVTAAFQRGYRLHGRVIRPSMVKVGSGAVSEQSTSETAH